MLAHPSAGEGVADSIEPSEDCVGADPELGLGLGLGLAGVAGLLLGVPELELSGEGGL